MKYKHVLSPYKKNKIGKIIKKKIFAHHFVDAI